MIFLKVVIAGFMVLEITNVAALYFFPNSKLANSVGVFKAWEKSKTDPDIHNFVKYLINWVAGTKLIFILLLGILLLTADENAMILTGGALVLSITSFFWRLFPQIKDMDKKGQIDPKNYSSVLWWMILGMIAAILISTLTTIYK
jgi:hypothetical protein